jgi:hypothetical protein
MRYVAIEPLNASSRAIGNTTLVIYRKAHVFGVCSRVRWSEPYIASFKVFYCKNPVTRTSMVYSVQRKRLNQGIYLYRDDIQSHDPESSQLICLLSLSVWPRKRPIF